MYFRKSRSVKVEAPSTAAFAVDAWNRGSCAPLKIGNVVKILPFQSIFTCSLVASSD